MSARNDDFPPQEAQERFEAAIRGARAVGHREMKDIPRKPRSKPQKKEGRRKVGGGMK